MKVKQGEYKLLLQELNIKELDNKEAITLTETQINRFDSNQKNIFEIDHSLFDISSQEEKYEIKKTN